MSEPRKPGRRAESAATRDRRLYEEALAALVNVTSEFSDLAKEDRVFRAPDGTLVKVKLFLDRRGELDASAPDRFRLKGSIVGPDGKALRRDDETLAVWDLRRGWSHKADTFAHPSKGADEARRRCVLETINAEAHRALVDEDLEGFVTVEEYTARKAAENGTTLEAEVEAFDAAELEPAVAAPAPEPAKTRHPSGRKYVLHPGYVMDGAHAVFRTAAEVAAQHGAALTECVVFKVTRPAAYYVGLTALFPAA